MKVVLFCGGLGLRMRGAFDRVPKPLVPIGDDPIVLHVMRYYAHFGHKDFVLCLGHRSDAFPEYFEGLAQKTHREQVTSERLALQREVASWNIRYVETGVASSIGQRLRAVAPLLAEEEYFLANYADGLTDLPLDEHVHWARQRDVTATFVSVPLPVPFHIVESDCDALVTQVHPAQQSGLRVNGGYFVLRGDIFDFIEEGDELVEAPFQRLIARRLLAARHYDGFWRCMDTMKDHEALEALLRLGRAPWQCWQTGEQTAC